MISVYRSPSRNFQYFIDNLEKILSMIYSNNTEIICGDINIIYLIDSTHKQLLDSILASYGLYSTVQVPTRITLTLRLTVFLLLHLNLVNFPV